MLVLGLGLVTQVLVNITGRRKSYFPTVEVLFRYENICDKVRLTSKTFS